MLEIIVVTIMYFLLLGLMIYKGAGVPEVLGAAVTFITAYWAFRSKSNRCSFDEKLDRRPKSKKNKENDHEK